MFNTQIKQFHEFFVIFRKIERVIAHTGMNNDDRNR